MVSITASVMQGEKRAKWKKMSTKKEMQVIRNKSGFTDHSHHFPKATLLIKVSIVVLGGAGQRKLVSIGNYLLC